MAHHGRRLCHVALRPFALVKQRLGPCLQQLRDFQPLPGNLSLTFVIEHLQIGRSHLNPEILLGMAYILYGG